MFPTQLRRSSRAGRAVDEPPRVIVVDSAALVDVLTALEGTKKLRADLTDEELHAPVLLDFEFVAALRGLTLGGQLSAVRAHDAFQPLRVSCASKVTV
jgi:predicted nucleic acid-binding protein